MTKEITKQIEVDGEVYSRVVEKRKSKQYFQFLKQNEKDYYEYKFDLLDLKYKFLWYYEHIPGHREFIVIRKSRRLLSIEKISFYINLLLK